MPVDAPDQMPAAQEAPATRSAELPAPAFGHRINPTNRALRFIVPLADNANYLGDVELTVAPDDSLSVVAPRLVQLLEPLITRQAFAVLKEKVGGSTEVSGATLKEMGITLAYDDARLALAVTVPLTMREVSRLSLREVFSNGGETLQPAGVSGYLNLRAAMDFIEKGPSRKVLAPVVGIDSAFRLGELVVEAEGYGSFRSGEPTFRRTGTRLVYDNIARTMRFSLGDVRMVSRSFQSTPSVAGLSVTRLYSLLDPQREVRSNGTQSFSLFAPSIVETVVNGRIVERKQLQPGNYSLQDFPLADGSNQVQLRVEDPTGQRRLINFDLYYSRALLAEGLTEFSAFAGVYAAPTLRGIAYSDDWMASGFVRKGVSQKVTAGLNFQADRQAQQIGGEFLLGSSLGLFGIDLSGSRSRGGKTGFAAAASIEKNITGNGENSQSLHLAAEHRSANFAVPGELPGVEPLQWRLTAGYTRNFGRDRYFTVDANYSRDRIARENRVSARAEVGFCLSDSLGGIIGAQYDHGSRRDGFMVRLGLRARFGMRSSLQVDADSRGTARASFQSSGGDGIGAWSTSADLARDTTGASLNANVYYVGNRFEGGINQLADYSSATSSLINARTSLRFSTALAFVDGTFAIGRPVSEGFIVARSHASLKGEPVRIDPRDNSEMARSGTLGPAMLGSLSAYSNRTLIYDVSNAPAGYDLGQGNIHIYPKYRAGYNLTVGSDYHLLVIGTLLDRNGEPIPLLTGTATELGAPKRAGVSFFTGRTGRFGIQSMRAGKWRVEMATEPPTFFEMDVVEDSSGTVRVGELRPVEQGHGK
ncbi:MAG: fimbrial biogenesis outer membrane usher protein [Novosphingobium sp.]